MSSKYYDGTELLSQRDINGEEPEIYLCTTNRTGGKTTWFNRLMLNRFIKKGSKFMLIYRFNYELDDVADKFFKDINKLFFPERKLKATKRSNGIYSELVLDDIYQCGYAVTLNSADKIKTMSHLFSDTENMLFDEFQSETNHYCNDEVKKLISIHSSVSRGQNKQVRRVPVYMLGNPVTILNPYYVEMGISDRLRSDTRFLKGDGFVLEQGYVESASNAQKESGFNRAFKSNSYVGYASQGIYLNDNSAFIEKPEGLSRYLCTLKYNGRFYAIREYPEIGVIYCDNRPDMSFPYKISVTTDDHEINYVMLKNNSLMISTFRYYFERGSFRFKDLACKEAILKTLSY